jgi:hypothetical protein
MIRNWKMCKLYDSLKFSVGIFPAESVGLLLRVSESAVSTFGLGFLYVCADSYSTCLFSDRKCISFECDLKGNERRERFRYPKCNFCCVTRVCFSEIFGTELWIYYHGSFGS